MGALGSTPGVSYEGGLLTLSGRAAVVGSTADSSATGGILDACLCSPADDWRRADAPGLVDGDVGL